jgi:hypothetical protein
MSEESGLITLKCVKNRFGERFTATIRPDYDLGAFALTDSPEFTKRTSDTQRMLDALTASPGLSQNAWHKAVGMMKSHFVKLVKENNGSLWREEKSGNSLRYFPSVLKTQNNGENNRTGQGVRNCSSVLSPLGENREQFPSDPGNCSRTDRSLPACSACGGYALYREKSGAVVCMTCNTTSDDCSHDSRTVLEQ